VVALDAVLVAGLGSTVGIAELLTRYRADPKRLLRTGSAWLYVALNAGSAVGALALILAFGWDFGVNDPDALRATQVLVAGFGAIALFRSSLFTSRIGGVDVGIGPITILTAFRDSVDRAVDRRQATRRSGAIHQLMSDVSFEAAYEALPAYCLLLMQTVSPQDQETLAFEVAELGKAQMTNELKKLSLGLKLMDLVGVDVLRTAIDDLGDHIKTSRDRHPVATLAGADLKGAALRGVSLEYADLSNAQLAKADLRFSRLNLARLTGANLEGADLTQAELRGADLRGANLLDATLDQTMLDQAPVRLRLRPPRSHR
jgi:hypothetical protein